MSISRKIFLLFFTFLLIISIASGQDSATTKIRITYVKLENPDTIYQVDSGLFLFHQYNAAFTYGKFITNTGSIGSATRNLVFEIPVINGFETGLHQFDPYILSGEKARYFNTYTPYTEFVYSQGAKDFQLFNILHSRNITPWWNTAIFYNGLNSTGFYYNQINKHKIFGATMFISTMNKRYKSYLSAIKNSFLVHENGGIQDDSLFESYSNANKKRTAVNLESTRQEMTVRNYSLCQYLNLGKAVTPSDTNLKPYNVNYFPKPFYLKWNTSYSENIYHYYSELFLHSGYYTHIFIDSNNTNDKLSHNLLTSDLSIVKTFGDQKKDSKFDFNLSAGIQYYSGKLQQDTIDSSFSGLKAVFSADKYLISSRLGIEGLVFLSGNNTGNYLLDEHLDLFVIKDFTIRVGIKQACKSPEFLNKTIYTNHLRWYNDFYPTYYNEYYLKMKSNRYKFDIIGSVFRVSNLISYNTYQMPVQTNEPITYYNISIKKELKAGWFHFDNHLLYQYSDHSQISLPELILNNCTYFEGKVFKQKLRLQAGINIYWVSSYYADGYYAPFSISYHQDEILVKSYPVMDVFLNANIKRMRIFLKYEHVNQGFPDYYGYAAPHYPFDPRVFRYGFSWMFFD